MPCRCDGYPTGEELALEKYGKAKAELDRTTQYLCTVLGWLENQGKKIEDVDRRVAKWWAAHKAADKARKDREREEKDKKAKIEDALAKLSDAEKKLLGLAK